MDSVETTVLASLREASASLAPEPQTASEIQSLRDAAKAQLGKLQARTQSSHDVKLLNAFIDHLHSDGQRVLCTYISSHDDETDLTNLARQLQAAVLTPMRAHGGKTPSVEPSPLDQDQTETEEVASEMIHPASRKGQKWLKNTCLLRDGWRCAVTGLWDFIAEEKVSQEVTKGKFAATEAAHVIPFCLGNYGGTGERGSEAAKRRDIERSWATLRLIFPLIQEVMKPDDINNPENAMTLNSAIHHDFGRLNLCLEPTDEENVYAMQTFRGFQTALLDYLPYPPENEHGQRLVKFQSHPDIKSPSRVLLAIHAAIARILHASGRADAIDAVLRDRDGTCVAADGSTDICSFLEVLAF